MIEYFKNKVPDQIDLINDIESHHHKIFLSKNDILLWPGEVCRKLYYLDKGAIMHRYTEEDTEKAVAFNFEGDFFTAFESYHLDIPSETYIQCIEDCELIFITKQDFKKLSAKHEDIYRIGFEYFQALYLKQFQISSRLVSYSVEKMYDYIIKEHPQIIRRIPLKFIAEFMGISKEHLSRLRKKIATNKNSRKQ